MLGMYTQYDKFVVLPPAQGTSASIGSDARSHCPSDRSYEHTFTLLFLYIFNLRPKIGMLYGTFWYLLIFDEFQK